MPSFPIIDSHVHFWNPYNLRYPWLDDIPLLNKPYLLPDYDEVTDGLVIEKMVFVQCECIFSQCEQEAEWVKEQAKSDSRIQAIIPWTPLEKGFGARDILDRFTESKLIKGVRRIIQFEPDPEFCLKLHFVEGVKMLADYDMSFDICISHKQMINTIKLVKHCPNVLFTIDHIGKPDIKGQLFDPWKKEIAELSKLDNVFCKISGLVTEADHLNWTKEDLAPYFDHVIECFGFDKVMFGGDWPVAIQASTYLRWVKTLDDLLSGVSDSELYKFYRKNAMDFYKLS